MQSVETESEGKTKSAGRLEYEEKKASYAEQRKRENAIKRLEKAIEQTEAELSEIDAQINDPANGTNVELLLELSEKKEVAEIKLEELYTEWDDLV